MVVFGIYYTPLDGVFQFPHISIPGLLAEPLHCLRSYRFLGQVVGCGKAIKEIIGQSGDIFRPLPQRRHMDSHGADPVKEVFAKQIVLDSLL